MRVLTDRQVKSTQDVFHPFAFQFQTLPSTGAPDLLAHLLKHFLLVSKVNVGKHKKIYVVKVRPVNAVYDFDVLKASSDHAEIHLGECGLPRDVVVDLLVGLCEFDCDLDKQAVINDEGYDIRWIFDFGHDYFFFLAWALRLTL